MNKRIKFILKFQIFLFIAFLYSAKPFCQNYTIFKSGPNTWGGAYVAPVWSKTYNFNTPAYQSPSLRSGTSNYSYPSSSQSSDEISHYVKKSKWNFKTDNGDNRDRYAEMKETVREAIDLYSSKLKKSVKLFYEGKYEASNATLDSLYGIPRTKRNFESYSAQGIWEIYQDATLEYF